MIEKNILESLDLNIIVKDCNNNTIYHTNTLAEELSNLNSNKEEFNYNNKWYKTRINFINMNDQKLKVQSFEDITINKTNEENYIKNIKILKKDALTCLYNRHGIKDIFNVIIKKKIPFSIILCDIDLFKKINDTYGHTIGDEALKYISETLKSNIRKIDYIGRYGGEEFLIILPFCDKYVAYRIAENIRERLNNNNFKTINNSNEKINVKITMTFGISEYRYDKSINDTINEADTALYQGKESGRNVANIYDEKKPY